MSAMQTTTNTSLSEGKADSLRLDEVYAGSVLVLDGERKAKTMKWKNKGNGTKPTILETSIRAAMKVPESKHNLPIMTMMVPSQQPGGEEEEVCEKKRASLHVYQVIGVDTEKKVPVFELYEYELSDYGEIHLQQGVKTEVNEIQVDKEEDSTTFKDHHSKMQKVLEAHFSQMSNLKDQSYTTLSFYLDILRGENRTMYEQGGETTDLVATGRAQRKEANAKSDEEFMKMAQQLGGCNNQADLKKLVQACAGNLQPLPESDVVNCLNTIIDEFAFEHSKGTMEKMFKASLRRCHNLYESIKGVKDAFENVYKGLSHERTLERLLHGEVGLGIITAGIPGDRSKKNTKRQRGGNATDDDEDSSNKKPRKDSKNVDHPVRFEKENDVMSDSD